MHGSGTYKSPSGDEYQGEWINGEQQDQIIAKYADGDRYEGGWKDAKPSGQGTFKYANGDIYEGEWRNGKINGSGVLKFSDGEVYKGEMKDGSIHGQGTLISPSGKIIATGEYRDGLLTKLQSVTIKEGKKTHFFEYENDKLFYTAPGATKKIEINLKTNKRILSVLEQFANTQVNQKSDDDSDVIKVQDSEDFQQKIRELQDQSKRDKSRIVKMIGIFGHAFTMVFEEGKSYCLDNGGLSGEKYQDYFKKLQNNNTEYRKFDFEKLNKESPKLPYYLNITTVDGEEIKIAIDPKDFVCRHKAKTFFEKLKELNSQPRAGSLFESFLEYYNKIGGMVRATSFSQLAGEKKQHSQPSF